MLPPSAIKKIRKEWDKKKEQERPVVRIPVPVPHDTILPDISDEEETFSGIVEIEMD